MDVIEEITEIVDRLNKIDEYNSTLIDNLSSLDCKQQDLLHYIENNKINVLWCYRMLKEMKQIRMNRRKVKNDIELLSKFNDQKTKIISKENRQFILTELNKKNKQLQTNYKNRQYTDEELQKILKGV